MIRKILALTATALPVLAFALTASAASPAKSQPAPPAPQIFTGNYLVSVAETKCGIAGNIICGNQSYCLVLTDDGGFGRPNSGPAVLNSFNSSPLSGEFQVIGNTIVVTLETGSSTGEADSVVLAAPANPSTGQIGIGIYDLAAGLSEASGLATFGVKNSCSI